LKTSTARLLQLLVLVHPGCMLLNRFGCSRSHTLQEGCSTAGSAASTITDVWHLQSAHVSPGCNSKAGSKSGDNKVAAALQI
jgi:hypothetical protein